MVNDLSCIVRRRDFLSSITLLTCIGTVSNCRASDNNSVAAKRSRFFFTSQGKTGLASTDGAEPKYLRFDVPGQATWQASSCFSDGRRVVLLSMETRRDGPGRPFEEYYTQTPTHLWQYDIESEALEEICKLDRIAPFTTPALLLSDERLLIQVVKNKVGQILRQVDLRKKWMQN